MPHPGRHHLRAAIAFAVVTTLSCGGDGGQGTAPPTPRISLEVSAVTFSATSHGANPPATLIAVTNGGTGTLSGLTIGSIGYPTGQPAGWLSASLASATAPTTATVIASVGTLAAGTYTATIPVISSATEVANSPRTIAVTFTVSPAAPVLSAIITSLSDSAIDSSATTTATATGRDQYGGAIATGPVTWSSAAENIVSISGTGLVTGVAPGHTTIKAMVGPLSDTAGITVRRVDPVAACRLPARFQGVALGFPRVAGRLKSLGDVHVPVVFVDFPDAPATRTPQSAFGLISPGAEAFYQAVSYGRMNLILEPTYTWYRMSQASSAYGWSALTFALHKAYIEEALSLTTTTDLSQADGFVILSNPDSGAISFGPTFDANPGDGATVRGITLDNGVTSGRDLPGWGSFWLNHEMGHAMSLVDLYALAGTTHRFVGGIGIMGLISGFAREYYGWERWQLGWLDDDQVSCASAPGTVALRLTPIERVGGIKMIVVPTGATTALVVESRRAEGYDTNGSWSPGVLVYSLDTSLPTGTGVLKVLPINDADTDKGTAPLQAGGSMTVGGVTVTFISGNGAGDSVRVVR